MQGIYRKGNTRGKLIFSKQNASTKNVYQKTHHFNSEGGPATLVINNDKAIERQNKMNQAKN